MFPDVCTLRWNLWKEATSLFGCPFLILCFFTKTPQNSSSRSSDFVHSKMVLQSTKHSIKHSTDMFYDCILLHYISIYSPKEAPKLNNPLFRIEKPGEMCKLCISSGWIRTEHLALQQFYHDHGSKTSYIQESSIKYFV